MKARSWLDVGHFVEPHSFLRKAAGNGSDDSKQEPENVKRKELGFSRANTILFPHTSHILCTSAVSTFQRNWMEAGRETTDSGDKVRDSSSRRSPSILTESAG